MKNVYNKIMFDRLLVCLSNIIRFYNRTIDDSSIISINHQHLAILLPCFFLMKAKIDEFDCRFIVKLYNFVCINFSKYLLVDVRYDEMISCVCLLVPSVQS